MITNAKNTLLDAAPMGLPNMQGTISGWFRKMMIGIVRKTVINFQTKEVRIDVETMGLIQPLQSKDLAIKPEGERSWQWYMLHVHPQAALQTDDQVTIRGKVYRVLGTVGWDEYGYQQMQVVKDYVPTRPI